MGLERAKGDNERFPALWSDVKCFGVEIFGVAIFGLAIFGFALHRGFVATNHAKASAN